MNPFEGLAYGFSVSLVPINILAAIIGAFIGTLVGVLPGLGCVTTMALLLPITAHLDPSTSLIMLLAIYYGAQFGGSTTSILMHIPGEASSVVTAMDGYEMAKKGRAGAALSIAAIGSFIAGTLGIVGLMFFGTWLAQFALAFGPPEFFAIAIFGLLILSRLSGGSLGQSILILSLGLALGTIGMEPISAATRYTFGLVQLLQGIDIVPVVIGLYGITEVISVIEKTEGLPQITHVKFRELFPTRTEWRRSFPAIFRGTGLGFFIGLLPGPSSIISTFASYKLEQRLSKHKEEFGHGAIEGVAGPESANNAATDGALIPLLSLGIPFGPATAVLLAALMIHGVQPGPLLISQHPEVFWGVVASMYIGNAALLILNLPLVGLWVSILRIPKSILLALIVLLCVVGTYSINNSMLDLVVMLVMGIVGYMFRKLKFDPSPLLVALILGPFLEQTFRQSLFMGQGNLLIFFERPISSFLLIVLIIILVIPSIRKFITNRSRSKKSFV